MKIKYVGGELIIILRVFFFEINNLFIYIYSAVNKILMEKIVKEKGMKFVNSTSMDMEEISNN